MREYSLNGAVALLLALVACCGTACWPEERRPTAPSGGPPNVILITIDTLRADHVSAYGDRKAKTPNLDRVASEGALFERAYCDVTWTTPSMTSTMLGQFATRHGLQTTFQTLREEEITLAEMLNAGGYATAAVIGSHPLSKIYNLDQGFEVYDDDFTRPLAAGDGTPGSRPPAPDPPNHPTKAEFAERDSWAFLVRGRRSDEEVSDRALQLLRSLADASRPFFLWVHYFGPHHIPDGKLDYFHDLGKHIQTYAARTGEVDAQVGRVLDALDDLGLEENTLLIVHSDHGESLGEHDYTGHGRFLYEDNLRVPLLMRWPSRIEAGTTSSALVGNVDIASTVLDAVAVEPAARPFDGRSLIEVLRTAGAGHSELVLETYAPTLHGFAEKLMGTEGVAVDAGAARFGLLRGHDKFIRTEPRPFLDGAEPVLAPGELEKIRRLELYELRTDPGESINRAGTDRVTAGELERALEAFRSAHSGVPANRIAPDPAHSEKLRSLGYVE